LALSGLLLALAGCNPLALFYVWGYANGDMARAKIKYEFPSNCRIAVVTYTPYGTKMEWGALDHEINERLGRLLHASFDAENRRYKRRVIQASVVQKWEMDHPGWHELPPAEIAAALKADYLIYLEIGALTLYKEGSGKMLYDGHAEVAVTVYHADENGCEQVYTDHLAMDFPDPSRPIQTSEMPANRFRQVFLNFIATRVSWIFLPHETIDEFPTKY
jgi:hypothetical protein